MGKLQFFVSRSMIVCACSILKSSLLHYTFYTIHIHYMTEKRQVDWTLSLFSSQWVSQGFGETGEQKKNIIGNKGP